MLKISQIIIMVLIFGMLVMGISEFTLGMTESYGVSENITSNLTTFNNSRMRGHIDDMNSAMNNTQPTGFSPLDAGITTGQLLISFINVVLDVPATIQNIIFDASQILGLPEWAFMTVIAILLVLFIFGIVSAITKYEL